MNSLQRWLFGNRIEKETERRTAKLRKELDTYRTWVPPGHFYSPIPSLDDIRKREDAVFATPASLQGIDLNAAGQLSLLDKFKDYFKDMPFVDKKTDGMRYYFDNENYSYGDATILHCMIRHLKPGKIIEIGSGFSSCASLDTNELFFNNSISCTFIEPYPELLYSLVREEDRQRIRIIPSRLQDVDKSVFTELSAGDILFVDSTHVSKTDSDVNHIFFDILPSLPSGVYIHIHDIFYPFEYRKDWVYGGRAWNEAYMLRAFLQYNERFGVMYFNDYVAKFHPDRLVECLPTCGKNAGGSIWLVKLPDS